MEQNIIDSEREIDLMLLVGWQERHPAWKNWVVGCWRDYVWFNVRFAYGSADAIAIHCLLLQ